MTVASIPKEALPEYQRWEMTRLDEGLTQSSQAQSSNVKSSAFSQTPRQGGLRRQAPQDEASKQVSEILKNVQQQAYDEGYKLGLQNGFAEGLTQADQQLADEKAQLVSLATHFSQALQEKDLAIADAVLTLALDLAKAMVKTKLQADPQAVIPIVLDAMHYLPQVQAPARLIVHHEDAKLLRQYLADELAEQHWQVLEDSSVERGGCLVETGENHIDATNEMRWKRITEALSRHDDWHTPALEPSE